MRSAAPSSATGVRIETWDGRRFRDHLAEAMHIYSVAMQYPEHTGTQRGASARKHIDNPGFACRAAVLDDGTVIGFGYGYTTAPGQWWHDLVQRAVSRSVAAEWLHDAFELSELHVLPDHHGAGIGRDLLTSLAAGIPQARMLLSTPDADTRAFRLYRDTGFVDLARNYLFPGDGRPFAVLGAQLPLRAKP